jgi:WD40 repeat protein
MSRSSSGFTRPRTCNAYHGNGDTFCLSNGPIDPAGRQVDLSDRPLICSSSNMRNEVVVGGSDHACYSIDVLDPRKKPITMYTKTCGHTDWVTSVTHLSDGSVLSTAMDGKLCLWSPNHRSQCIDLARSSIHPISKVVSDLGPSNNSISCGYDGNIEIWKLNESSVSSSTFVPPQSSRSKLSSSVNRSSNTPSVRLSPAAILSGHADPVLECSYYGDRLASGDKGGNLMVWDLQRGEALHRFRAHPGPITAIECNNSSNVIITAATDGFVKIWDPRSAGSGLVAKVPVYVHETEPSRASSSLPKGGRGRNSLTAATARGGRTSVGRSAPSSSSMLASSTPVSYPVSMMACTYSRGSSNDMNYIITGGGSPEDCRIVVLDSRNNFQPVCSWDHHRNGVYSLCVVGDNAVFSGDGVGTVLCHRLLESEMNSNPRTCLKYGMGASEKGAVRSIQCLQNKLVTCGEDGKVLIFDF